MRGVRAHGWRLALVAGLAAGEALAAGHAGVTLGQCIQAALAASPDLRAAESRADAARAAVGEAQSAYYPQVTLGAGWTRTDNPPQAFFMRLNQRTASLQEDFNQPDDTDNVRGSAGVRWRVYDGGRRTADRRAAGLSSEAGGLLTEAALNELVFQVTRAYYGVLQASALVEVQREAVASIEESLRVANERLKAGNAIRTDVLNLEVQGSQAREDLIRVTNGRRLAVAALNTAVGAEVWTGAAEAPPAAPLEALSRPPACERGIERRPELGAARLQAGAAEAMLQRARRDYHPVINVFGSADWDGETPDAVEQSYLVGAAAELNVFDGFRTRGAVAGARAMRQAAVAMTDKLRNELQLDLTRALLREEESWERTGVAEKSLQSAAEALRITRERYQQGAADITELLTAQVGYTATRTRLVAAHYDYRVARSDVERACGTLGAEWRKRAAAAAPGVEAR